MNHLLVRARRPSAGRRSAVLGAALLGVFCFQASQSAQAAWPPAAGATATEMKDPANWPNDPMYAYRTSGARYNGQWVLYSFIPDRAADAKPVRTDEIAAGMSVDLAWRHTIGDDKVVIAVLDSGIRWHNPEGASENLERVWDADDLRSKAYLNAGELQNHKPLMADGTACGGSGPFAGFDCNGDGVLNVDDYAETPSLAPPADASHPKGDANLNGEFDPGDLILIYSDGTDDDGNSYVDDISGWDFLKNDNDPFDDTNFTHGSQEAGWSSAATNDGQGFAGTCPLCRFIPLRVSDSFIADTQDFAKAVVYAVDNGAQIVQEALGTVSMSSFAYGALDYAWSKNVLVVGSMGDENARHHNMPSTANHVLPVHAITLLSPSENALAATSFLAYNNCTNFGAQNFLSASGGACSSEAAGRTAGIAGLIYAAALEAGTTPALTPDEVMQILLTSAEDIDIPESREPESLHYWSQKGFDQRFGYGRINANSAVEWVGEGRIPPEVDIVEPTWFEVLYADRATGPVPLRGRVSAKRADSYDYAVAWAPGVQPLDEAFQVIKEETNVPGSTETGGDTPLAELDLASIDPTHEADPDSPFGENRYTITVRVRATAHYGGSIGDVRGELRRAYAVHEDPDLLPGFPLELGSSGESSPKLADIDGDGVRDVVLALTNGTVHAFRVTGDAPEELRGFPFKAKPLDGLDGDASRGDHRNAPAYAQAGVDADITRESFTTTPAIADLNGDDKLDIVASTTQGTIYAIGNDGAALPGWPVRLPDVPSCPLDGTQQAGALCMGAEQLADGSSITKLIARGAFASPVLEDLNGDDKLEIIQAAFDGFVHVIKSDGQPLEGWPVRVHFPNGGKEYNRILTTPAVADFNGDGTPDIVVGSNEKLGTGGAGAFYIIDGRGMLAGNPPYLNNWPIRMVSLNLFPLIAEGVPISPIVANMKGGGTPYAIMHGNASAPVILPADPGTQATPGATPSNAIPERINRETGDTERGLEATSIFGAGTRARKPDTMFPLFASPSAGDLDQDGTPDVIASGASLSVANNLLSTQRSQNPAQYLLGMWNGTTGRMFPGSPVPLEDFTFFNNQAIADLTGDGYPEVLTGTGGYYIRAVDACGREAAGWPKFVNQWVIATTAVGDVTGDGKLDVVVPTRSGWLYAWRTKARTDAVISWESFHHDNRNTGNLNVPLEQGKLRGAKHPLRIDENGLCAPEAAVEDEGCACRLVEKQPGRTRAAWWTLVAGAALLFVRRRYRKLPNQRGRLSRGFGAWHVRGSALRTPSA